MDGLTSVAHILLAVISGNLPPLQKALMTSCRLWGAGCGHRSPGLLGAGC